jgi:hypothetical protein
LANGHPRTGSEGRVWWEKIEKTANFIDFLVEMPIIGQFQ